MFIGRSLLLTAAMGLLLEGPINSINYNVEQVVNSITCMYNEMSLLACQFQLQFSGLLLQFGNILKGIFFRNISFFSFRAANFFLLLYSEI